MAICCKQCGATLTERDAFCTKCGAPRSIASEAAAAPRFCAKCGAGLAGETKFCTKCGATNVPQGAAASAGTPGASAPSFSAATGSPPQVASSGTATAKSPAGIPKIALVIGGVVVLVIIVAVVAGVIGAVHRARERAQAMEAAEKFEKNLAKLTSSGNAAASNGSIPSAADINKAVNGLAAAANAFAQNAQKQGGANSLNTVAGIAAAVSGATAASNSNEASNPKNANGGTAGAALGSNGSTSPPRSTSAAVAATSAAADAVVPKVPPAATGNQAHDWALKYERTVGGPEADLVVRTGDINNLGSPWPNGYDPFSGQSESAPWPDGHNPPHGEPAGTDRLIIGSGVFPGLLARMADSNITEELVAGQITLGPPDPTLNPDGYSGGYVNSCHASVQKTTYSNDAQLRANSAADCVNLRRLTMPQPIVLPVGALPAKINAVLFQVFADDFQALAMHSHFQMSLNGTRIPNFENAINSIDESGPVGRLLTFELLPGYWSLLKSGDVKLLIDDPTTHAPDGYAVDFVRILVNPHKFKYQVSLTATVTDADTHKPVSGATVSAGLSSTATDKAGKCELKGIPAGLVVTTANAPGYDESSVPVDLPAGQSGHADIALHRHQESTAALEQSIAQTGTATIYGIHFDTGSPKFRLDSLPALQAVLGLINGRPGSNWIIAGHTDNQGSDKINIPLSKARAASVIAWLTAHGVAANRLEPQGFGSTRPVADNSTANGRFLNRRVEVSLAK